MVKIKKMNREDFWQCSSCLRSTEEIDMYEIKIGKNLNQQYSVTRLCYNCLCDLQRNIILLENDRNERTDSLKH